MKKDILLFAACCLLTVGCNQQVKNTPAGEEAQQEEEGGLFSSITNMVTGGISENSEEPEEPDETFANYANAPIESFISFENREQAILQQAASVGCQGNIWWYADSVNVYAVVQFISQYANDFTLVEYSPSNQTEYTLIPQGQNSQGNYVFLEDLSKERILISADESRMISPKIQRQFSRTSASQCNDVMTYRMRKELYVNHKYEIFQDFVAEIGKAYGALGIDLDRDMRVWGNEKAVYALVDLPQSQYYAFAEYQGWSMNVANGERQGQASDGSSNYAITNNSLNLRTSIQISADGGTLTAANNTFRRINIKTATRLISTLRDEQDKRTTPQQFDQMYQTYANLAANKIQYINNLNVKEVYKFSARSDLRDAQFKMRNIRQRALKTGYQMQPSPYEGQDPSYDPGQKYQYERDGVNYGMNY